MGQTAATLNNLKRVKSKDSSSSSIGAPSVISRDRSRFYNAHHTWNTNNLCSDEMYEFIRSCNPDKNKEKNLNKFYTLLNKLLLYDTSNIKQCEDRNFIKKIIRLMRLLHAYMTLAINNNKYWLFVELGNKMYSLYNIYSYNNRICIDYERIMGDILCLATLKENLHCIKYLVLSLQIDTNLQCEGGETALIICAEHNYPDITLFLLSNGADSNCNNYLSSDSCNTPAQISASWQHLKVLYYLIIYGAKSDYYNIHLRSVQQYAKYNHSINYIVQKALNKQIIRNKLVQKILHKLLLHPNEYRYYLQDDRRDHEEDDFDSEFDIDEDINDYLKFCNDNFNNFNIYSNSSDHFDDQIRSNINKSLEYVKKNRNSFSSNKSNNKVPIKSILNQTDPSSNLYIVNKYDQNDPFFNNKKSLNKEKQYLIKPIISIIYSMII